MSRFIPGPSLDEIAEAAAHAKLLEVAESGAWESGLMIRDDSGHYRRTIEVFDDGRGVGWQSGDAGAVAIEYGAIQAPAQAPIRRGATKVGKFKPR